MAKTLTRIAWHLGSDIAERLGALTFLKEEDGSAQIFRIMNPERASRQAVDSEQYKKSWWMWFFTGKSLGKKEIIRQKWIYFRKEVAGDPRWRKIFVRLQLENAALKVRAVEWVQLGSQAL